MTLSEVRCMRTGQRKDPLRNPAGHWIDYCKRRAQELKGSA